MATVLATLLAQVQHLEDLVGDQPIKDKPAPPPLPTTNAPSAPETDLTDLISRLQQLEENGTHQLALPTPLRERAR